MTARASGLRVEGIHVRGYRSLRDFRLGLRPLHVVVGANGAGKSNLYAALAIMASAARGTFARSIAREGGMPSVLWAGPPRSSGPLRLCLEVQLEGIDYALECGLPTLDDTTAFARDPIVKEERITVPAGGRARAAVLERGNRSVFLRDAEGVRVTYPVALWEWESALSQIVDPTRYPVVAAVRAHLLSWRFYHHFPTDAAAPARVPQVATRTPVLASDGSDVAAALQTILEIGDGAALERHVTGAFPGARLRIEGSSDQRFIVTMQRAGLRRALEASELSDGTLRYLCLVAALLSPRPPALLALNEPETSLHPDLFEPLAALIVDAAERSQVLVTTHAEALARALERATGAPATRIACVGGETVIEA